MNKSITFHINNEAYTIDIGKDLQGNLESGLKKFLSTDDNLTTQDLLLAYLLKSQELVQLDEEIQEEILKFPTLDNR